MSDVWPTASLRLATIWGGMPHQTLLSLAYLSNFDCEETSELNSPQASCAEALRVLAALTAAAFFSVSSRSLMNSWRQGDSCCCCGAAGANCAFAVPAQSTSAHIPNT